MNGAGRRRGPPGLRHATAWVGLLAAALAGPLQAAADQPCRNVGPAAKPAVTAATPAAAPGCHCRVQAQPAARLCSCAAPDGTARWQLQRPGAAALQWPDEPSAQMGMAAYRWWRADLDGDGQPEELVLRELAESNGRGVRLQRLCVVPGGGGAPACRELTDWGWITRLVHEAGRAGCSLMQAEWQTGEEAGRGEGTYAVGRLQRWSGSDWQPVPEAERPAPQRRLLQRFERTRARTLAQPQAPLWWQHPEARPACPGPLCPP